MDSFELNKIIGAVLGTLLFVMGIGFAAEAIYAPIEGRGVGLALPEPDVAAHGQGETGEPAPTVPLGTLLAAATIEDGTAATKKCAACHTFDEGGSDKSGPNLYGVVGRQIASHGTFKYSPSLAAHGAAGDTWTYENLDAFLTKPKAFATDTKMTFNGEPDPEQRANILVFLSSLAATPVPFPAAEAAPVAEGEAAAPADGETATPATEGEAGSATEGEIAAPAAEGEAEVPAAETTEAAPATETPAETPATEAPAELTEAAPAAETTTH